MLGSTRRVRVFAWSRPADLRRGYNGLYAMVVNELERDPLSGDLYVFCNRRRTSCKVLYFDGTGLCIFMKRLEEQKFAALWREGAGDCVELTQSELSLFIEGCQLVGWQSLSPEVIGERVLVQAPMV